MSQDQNDVFNTQDATEQPGPLALQRSVVAGVMFVLGTVFLFFWNRHVNTIALVFAGFVWATTLMHWFVPENITYETLSGGKSGSDSLVTLGKAALLFYTFAALFVACANTMAPFTVAFTISRVIHEIALRTSSGYRARNEYQAGVTSALLIILTSLLLFFRKFTRGALASCIGSVLLMLGADVFVDSGLTRNSMASLKKISSVYNFAIKALPDAETQIPSDSTKNYIILVICLVMIVVSVSIRSYYKYLRLEKLAKIASEEEEAEMLLLQSEMAAANSFADAPSNARASAGITTNYQQRPGTGLHNRANSRPL